MLLLAFLLAASARAGQFAQSPAQMTASAREYFASPSAEPAGLAATLRTLDGVDLTNPASSLALENLTDETRKAADDLLANSEALLSAKNRVPAEDELARSVELFHVLQRTSLSRLLTDRQRAELFRYEHEIVTLTEKETAARVEKRLAALSEGLERLSSPAAVAVDLAAPVERDIRRFFASPSSEPAAFADTLAHVRRLAGPDGRGAPAYPSLRAAADEAADELLADLQGGAWTQRSALKLNVLIDKPLAPFVAEGKRAALQGAMDVFALKHLAEFQAGSGQWGQLTVALARRALEGASAPKEVVPPAAPSSAQIVADIKTFFGSTSADLKAFQPALAALSAAQKSGRRDQLDLAAIQEQVRAGADTLASDLRQALETGSDFESAKRLTLRLQLVYFSPMGEFTTREQRTELRQLIEKFGPRYPEGYQAGLRLWNDALSALNGRKPAPATYGPSAAAAGSSVGARRAERELARYRRQTRSSSRRPAVDKPVTIPDWLRGPAPLSPAMERAHQLADALGAAKEKTARLAAARALADFARTQPNDEEVQRHAARALAEALGRQEDGRAVDETLARLAAFSQFGRIQEIAAAALEEQSSHDALAAVGLASSLPHVRALVAKSGTDAAAAPARLAVDALLDAAAGAAAVGRQKQAAEAVGRAAKAALAGDAALKEAAHKRMLAALQPALRTWERSPYFDALTAAVVDLEGGWPVEDASLAAWRERFRAERMKGPEPAQTQPTEWLEPVLRRLKAAGRAVAEYWKDIRSFNPGEID